MWCYWVQSVWYCVGMTFIPKWHRATTKVMVEGGVPGPPVFIDSFHRDKVAVQLYFTPFALENYLIPQVRRRNAMGGRLQFYRRHHPLPDSSWATRWTQRSWWSLHNWYKNRWTRTFSITVWMGSYIVNYYVFLHPFRIHKLFLKVISWLFCTF